MDDPITGDKRLLPPDGHLSVLCHEFSELLVTLFFDMSDAGLSVRPENESEQTGHEIVIHFTIIGVSICLAICTALVSVFKTAASNLAPGRFFVSLATSTLAV